jgi:hypothetical protein
LIEEEFARVPARGERPQAYIECGMQTASQRQDYDGAEYGAPQRQAACGEPLREHDVPVG